MSEPDGALPADQHPGARAYALLCLGALSFLVMALVLAFRPEGLFQRTAARKI